MDWTWRCSGCDKTLAKVSGFRVHIHPRSEVHYIVNPPVVCTCPNRHCRLLNELSIHDIRERRTDQTTRAGRRSLNPQGA